MVRDISGFGSSNRNDLRTDRYNNGSESKKTEQASQPTPTPVNNGGDRVELSDQAQSLKSIEDKLSALPDVDQDRVDALKAAIDNGSYVIDNKRLAEKLLSADALFGK